MNITNLKQLTSGFNMIYLTQPLFNACFYGIRAIFVLYVINRFSLTDTQAVSLFATFMTLCYGTSLIGGYIANKGLGVKDTSILGGILTVAGLLCISFPSEDCCFLGLALISLGSGCFKPNLMTAVGMIFEDPKDPRKDRAYSIMYMVGNLGILIVPTLCSFVEKDWGGHYAILLLGVIFTVATYLVYKTIRLHPSWQEKQTISINNLFWGVLFLIAVLYLLFKYRDYFHGLMGILTCASIVCLGKIYIQCNREERRSVLTVKAYTLLFAICASFGEQAGSSMVLFYKKAVNRHVFGFELPSSALLSLGSIFVLFCMPLQSFLSARYLEKTKPLNGFVKMGCGFVAMALGFWVLSLSAWQDEGSLIPLSWIALAIFIQTLGELWIAPISMSKVSQHSPARLQSIMMSFWPMAIAYGHYFGGVMAQFSLRPAGEDSFARYQSFFFYLGLLALGVGILVLLCRGIKSHVFGKLSEERG
jgi:POT family proton-dependent oligopeptide transporter